MQVDESAEGIAVISRGEPFASREVIFVRETLVSVGANGEPKKNGGGDSILLVVSCEVKSKIGFLL